MLHEKLKKMMSGKKDMPKHEKDVKMNVVNHMRAEALDAMKHKMGSGAKHQVSVASDSPEGLQAGLEQAKQVVGQDPSQMGGDSDSALRMSEGGDVPEHDTSTAEEAQMVHDAENPEHDALSAHEEHDPEEDMDEDELNAKLEKLMKMKESRSKKSSNPY